MKVSQSLSRQVVGVCLFGVLSSLSAAAQATPRIAQPVEGERLITLRGHTHPLARPEYDHGAAPESLPMQGMLLVLKRAPEQEAALQKLMDDQQDKSSPNYRELSVRLR
jgi:hypothetical protein